MVELPALVLQILLVYSYFCMALLDFPRTLSWVLHCVCKKNQSFLKDAMGSVLMYLQQPPSFQLQVMFRKNKCEIKQSTEDHSEKVYLLHLLKSIFWILPKREKMVAQSMSTSVSRKNCFESINTLDNTGEVNYWKIVLKILP